MLKLWLLLQNGCGGGVLESKLEHITKLQKNELATDFCSS